MNETTGNTIGIYVGVDKGVVQEIHKLVMAILSSGAEQETLRKALDVVQNATSVKNNTISNCSVTTN